MNKTMLGSDNVANLATPDLEAASKAVGQLLDALRIDWRHDVNMVDTPNRVAKMFVEELFVGRYVSAPVITEFKSTRKHESLIVSGPWDVKSICAHHLIPVSGVCFIGVLPNVESNLLGLSKYGRIVDWFSRRPTLQEDLVEQIADYFMEKINPAGIAIYISATHMCCTHRGINATASRFITTALRGDLFDASIKAEFLTECHMRLK